ncbi:MAG: McrC family protein, partial [Planctomycetota bacterium]
DIHENRLLKAAIAKLGNLRLRDPEIRDSLRRFDLALSPVSLVIYDPWRLPEITYSRLNDRYEPAVELAKIILGNGAFELHHGEVRGSAVLFDMAKVVEDFVLASLRDALGASRRSLCQAAKDRELHLDTRGRVSLEPDVSWWDGPRCRFVGDIKYKTLKDTKARQDDLYQLLAYTVATELPGGLLIYAAEDAEPDRHTVRFLGKQLEICTLDLSGSSTEILAQIEMLAERIRRLSKVAA